MRRIRRLVTLLSKHSNRSRKRRNEKGATYWRRLQRTEKSNVRKERKTLEIQSPRVEEIQSSKENETETWLWNLILKYHRHLFLQLALLGQLRQPSLAHQAYQPLQVLLRSKQFLLLPLLLLL